MRDSHDIKHDIYSLQSRQDRRGQSAENCMGKDNGGIDTPAHGDELSFRVRKGRDDEQSLSIRG